MKDKNPKLIARARRLRQTSTKSEVAFWERVRGGQIDGAKIRRQVPLAGMVVDFACVSSRLVIEIDGGVHNDPAVKARDVARDQRLQAMGYQVLRFGDGAIFSDLEAIIWVIKQTLNSPSPPLGGEGLG